MPFFQILTYFIKIYLLISPTPLSENSVRIGNLSNSWWLSQFFLNSNFLLKAWIFHCQQIISLVTSLKWQDDLFYFKVNVCQILKAIFCLSVNFSSKNCIPWKGDCYNSQLKWTSALSKESHDSQKCFFVYFSICQRKY